MAERRGAWWLACVPLLCLAACGDADMPSAGDPECAHLGWREPTPGAVVCPGTPDCLCDDGDVCCVAQDDEQRIVAARCMPPDECSELPIRCDGPEDCADDRVCCFRARADGGGAGVPEPECAREDALRLCRADADCTAELTCSPAEPGTYFDAAAAFCRD